MEISSPIPQNEIEIGVTTLPVEDEKNRAVVMRAQSLRDSTVTPRPAIPNFGSMRQPNFKRPTSIPAANRPTSPPPPRPPVPEMEPTDRRILKIPGLPGYQQPTVKSVVPSDQKSEYQYDDCMNEAPLAKISEEISPNSGDNIYAVIEESPNPNSKPLENVKSNSGSSESVGLLGEIVNEIQNRNFDSIYSTSTLARKKKESLDKKQKNKSNDKEKSLDTSDVTSDTYVNTSAIYKSPESVYSNMGNLKSSASSTASGYIHPSAVNAPVVKPASTSAVSKNTVGTTNAPPPKNVLSTFKGDPKTDTNTYKPFAASLQRTTGPLAAASTLKSSSATNNTTNIINNNKSAASDVKVTSPVFNSTANNTGTTKATKPLSRQTTPPNINRQKTPPNITRQTTPPNITRQTTPPNLRTRKPSPTRTVPSSPKNLSKTTSQKSTNSNSPDLVISCSNTSTSNTKSPDVLNSSAKMNGKPNGVLPKPLNITPKAAPKTLKPLKSPTDKKPLLNKSSSDVKPPISAKINKANSDVSSVTNKTLPAGPRLAAKQTSHVATLQQKFENNKPPPVASKTIAKKK
ncbi:hypothetical protein CBL_00503 [Carabus blaptoides fortunei]